MADLAAVGGQVAMRERPVADAEVGRPLAAIASGLGLRVIRGERGHGFFEPEADRLEPGDTILEIVPRAIERADQV